MFAFGKFAGMVGAHNAGMVKIQKIHLGVSIGDGKAKPHLSFENYRELNELISIITKND